MFLECFSQGKNELRWIVWIQWRRRWTNVILITASSTICRDYCHLSGKNPLAQQAAGLDLFTEDSLIQLFFPLGEYLP
ncbi:hypothetical protein AV530_013416 [Patagioenas fasciata monilis]|uniref:Uncharacterized protein n=1 Tax=Patagioenas fasciata monilis TaxID=372326 RepID=A0A1V4JQL2_PATFA|nr:hypothetical protein AV530_013416 [Patagioenas fasciata monilis]